MLAEVLPCWDMGASPTSPQGPPQTCRLQATGIEVVGLVLRGRAPPIGHYERSIPLVD